MKKQANLRKSITILAALFALTALLCPEICADTVKLKHGGSLKGEVLKEDERGVTLKVEIGTVTIPRERVEAVIYEETTHLELGDEYFKVKKYEKAIAEYEKMLRKHPGSKWVPTVRYKIGLCHYKTRDYGKAVGILESVVDEYAHADVCEKALALLVRIFTAQKKIDEGIIYFGERIKTNPTLALNHCGLALLHEERETFSEAVEAWEKFADLTTGNTKTRVNKHIFLLAEMVKAQKCLKANDFTAALPLLEKVVEDEYPASPIAFAALKELGHGFFKQGAYGKAVGFHRKTVKKFPDRTLPPLSFFEYAESLRHERMFARALPLYQRLITLSDVNHNEEIHYGLADCYLNLKKWKQSADSYRSFLAKYPESAHAPGSTYGLGLSLIKTGQRREAIRVFEPFIENYPQHELMPEVRWQMASYYENKKNYSQAIEHYGAIANEWSESPLAPKAQYRMALLYYEQEDYGKSEDVLNQFLSEHPQSKLAGIARQKLKLIQREREASKLYQKAKSLFDQIDKLKWDYSNLPKYNQVIRQAQHVISACPRTETAIKSQYLIVQCYDKQAKCGKKSGAFNKYVSMVEKYWGMEKAAQAISEMGDAYFDLGGIEYSNAIKYYRLLLNKYPKSGWIDHAYDKLYVIYKDCQNNHQKAIKVSQEYLRTYPKGSLAPSFQLRLAFLYSNQKKPDKAISEFQKIIKKYPQSEEAKMSKEYIELIKKGYSLTID